MHKCGARAKVYKNGAGGLSCVVFQKKKSKEISKKFKEI